MSVRVAVHERSHLAVRDDGARSHSASFRPLPALAGMFCGAIAMVAVGFVVNQPSAESRASLRILPTQAQKSITPPVVSVAHTPGQWMEAQSQTRLAPPNSRDAVKALPSATETSVVSLAAEAGVPIARWAILTAGVTALVGVLLRLMGHFTARTVQIPQELLMLATDAVPATTDLAAARAALKAELLDLLGNAESGTQRIAGSAFSSRGRVEQVVNELVALNPTTATAKSELLLGRWRLLTTFKPGVGDVDFFSPESWRKYIWEKGPSPVQALVLGSGDTSNVFQTLQDPSQPDAVWQNTIEFGAGNRLTIEAALEGIRDDDSFFYRFNSGFFELSDGKKYPYPVPFGLLETVRPGQTKGWFETTYLDEDIRVSVGNKGSVFVLQRA
uniref:Plastid lipid-associated protein/fibrillin conserved domain-containing protein n=1 Tax=Eutreptiella gymnastica TaxID=73025 RepID=A0A7S1NIU2_9EUGL|mmetsp:Transcript_42293/g.75752  ORF Transcript_42293/g.75752 Transcript_42293/m.75752 type:complete len:388 (+) Transcript_42293:38-1201(+)